MVEWIPLNNERRKITLDMISSRAARVRSDIRGPLYYKALKMEAEGKKVLKLNTGNPAAFGFPMPESIREALQKGMEQMTAYSLPGGMTSAKEAVFHYHRFKGVKNFKEEDIFLTNGVSEGVETLCLTLFNKADEVLLPTPNYSLWENSLYLADAKPVFYRCNKNDFSPDIEDMEKKITPHTKAILLISPNNPTGAVYSKETLLKVISLARKHDLILCSDEIYDRLILDGKEHISTAALAEDLLCITFNGISKSHVVCGLRGAWMVLSGPEKKRTALRDGLGRLFAMRLCPNTASQIAIEAAMKDTAFTEKMIRELILPRRDMALSVLDTIPGISYVKNSAAFYLFPKLDSRFHITDDRRFAMDLLEAKNILIVPGSGFSYPAPDRFRLVLLPDPSVLKNAMEDLGDFLSDYRQDQR